MESNNPLQNIKAAESVREAINQDGAVLLDIKQGLCFNMNPVGARIWEMLRKEYSFDQIASALELEFGAPRAQIERDIAEFIENLKARSLVLSSNIATPQGRSWFSRLQRRFK